VAHFDLGFNPLRKRGGQVLVSPESRDGGVDVRGTMLDMMGRLLPNHILTSELLDLVCFLLPEEEVRRLDAFSDGCRKTRGKRTPRRRTGRLEPAETGFESVADPEEDVVLEYEDSMPSPPDPPWKNEKPSRKLFRMWQEGKIEEPDLRRRLLEALERGAVGARSALRAPFPDALLLVRDSFGLTDTELGLLTFLYCYRSSKSFETFCDTHDAGECMRLLGACVGVPESAVKRHFAASGRLLGGGLVERMPHNEPPFALNGRLADCLSGLDPQGLSGAFFEVDERPTFPLDSFGVPQAQLDLLLALLSSEQPVHILLEGVPGTGKSELARALCAALGRKACAVRVEDPENEQDRRMAILAAAHLVRPGHGILIVDEADSLLGERGGPLAAFGLRVQGVHKAWLNDFLDRTSAQTVFICNHSEMIPESVLRRFLYSVKFPKFSRVQRERAWRNAARRTPLGRWFTDAVVRDLAERYQVSAAAIGMAVKAALIVLAGRRPADGADQIDFAQVHGVLHEILVRHEEHSGIGPREHAAPPVQYDSDAIHADTPVDTLVEAAERFLQSRESAASGDGGLNLLFWGLPGTGKTEFARYLAARLGRQLVIQRASDLLDKFVGETEKRLRAAFDQAERDGAVLLLDEADSLLSDRRLSSHSWETSQVNELLSAMERFKGILICCTNFRRNLDRAALRRFAWKVEFKPLDPNRRVAVYDRYFGPLAGPLPGLFHDRLAAVPKLTFGDIRAIWTRMRHLSRDKVTHEAIVEALENEAKLRGDAPGKRTIGFGR
jgi:SpoVK/Ycf46/Vps4 family AAA+-type ATPase